MKRSIGYKVMPIIDGKLTSGANKNLGNFTLRKGSVIQMPGKGIYLSNNKKYVIDNYSGLADEEALIAFEFNPDDIIWGNTSDREAEFTVAKAKILGFQLMVEGEFINKFDRPKNDELKM